MKLFPGIISVLVLSSSTEAFAPTRSTVRSAVASTQRHVFDPSVIIGDVHQQMDTLANVFTSSSMALSDAAEATAEVAKNDNGWFGFLEGPIEFILKGIHATLVGMGMNEDAWGVTIIAMTTLIKLATYPLTKSQLESTNKMQVSYTLIVDTFLCLEECIFVVLLNQLSFEIYIYIAKIQVFGQSTAV